MRISDWSSDVCSSDLIGISSDIARCLSGLPVGFATRFRPISISKCPSQALTNILYRLHEFSWLHPSCRCSKLPLPLRDTIRFARRIATIWGIKGFYKTQTVGTRQHGPAIFYEGTNID